MGQSSMVENLTIFHHVGSNHCETISQMIEDGTIHINYSNEAQRTILCCACGYGNLEMVNLLLDHGADVNLADINGVTPLRQAVKNGYTEIVKLLLEHKANINCSVFGDTLMHIATCRGDGYLEIVKLLVEYGAAINTFDYYRRTPLSNACKYKNLKMVKFLIEHGANVHVKHALGGGLLKQRNLTLEIVKLLVDHGARFGV